MRNRALFETPEYRAWSSMLNRCRDKTYRNYGARGITVCARWDQFQSFLADVGLRPSPLHSLDRYPDPNGNYEPDNVRWATRAEQARNKRTNVHLVIGGESRVVADWARSAGLSRRTLHNRLNAGWSPEQAVSTPRNPVKQAAGRQRHRCYGQVGERAGTAGRPGTGPVDERGAEIGWPTQERHGTG